MGKSRPANPLIATSGQSQMTTPPASRNDPCPCGSGKRYKACHGALASVGAAPTPDAAAPDRHADGLLDRGDFVGAAPAYTAMHIHVINLDRSVARLDEFRRWNAHMPEIERFAAIDGAAVDRQQLLRIRDKLPRLIDRSESIEVLVDAFEPVGKGNDGLLLSQNDSHAFPHHALSRVDYSQGRGTTIKFRTWRSQRRDRTKTARATCVVVPW